MADETSHSLNPDAIEALGLAGRRAPEMRDPMFDEIKGDNPRAALIVGAAMLENALERMLRAYLRSPASDKEAAVLFSDNGIVGTFYEKIWMAYFLRLIGPATRRDFDLVRAVRNYAAHSRAHVSFDTPQIADRCRELHFPTMTSLKEKLQRPEGRNPRQMFRVSVNLLSAAMMMRAGNAISRIDDVQVIETAAALLNCLDQ